MKEAQASEQVQINPIAIALTDGLWGLSVMGVGLGSRGRATLTPLEPKERETLAQSVDLALSAYDLSEAIPPWAIPLVTLGALISGHVVILPPSPDTGNADNAT